MLAHVHQRLLDDPDDLYLGGWRQLGERSVPDVEVDSDSVLDAELVQILGERGLQPEATGDEGAQAEDRLADVLVGKLRDVRHLPQQLGDSRRRVRERQRGLQLQAQQGERLREAVVHLAGQALPLLYRGRVAKLVRQPRRLDRCCRV